LDVYRKNIETLIGAINNQFNIRKSLNDANSTPDQNLEVLGNIKTASENLQKEIKDCIILFR